MSTATKTKPSTTTRHGDEPLVFHYITKTDLAFSREVGIQVRAICGAWLYCNTLPGEGGTAASVMCRRCEEIYVTLPGAK